MWYQINAEALIIQLYIQPGAKKTAISGMHHDALKIRLNAPPLEGKANEALLKLISQLFAVPLCQVALIRGEKSRFKTLRISGSKIDPDSILI